MIILGLDGAYRKGFAIAAYDTDLEQWADVTTAYYDKSDDFSPRRFSKMYNSVKKEIDKIVVNQVTDARRKFKIYIEQPFMSTKHKKDDCIRLMLAAGLISLIYPENTAWVKPQVWRKQFGEGHEPKRDIQKNIKESLLSQVLEDLNEPNRKITMDQIDSIGITYYGLVAETCCIPECRDED